MMDVDDRTLTLAKRWGFAAARCEYVHGVSAENDLPCGACIGVAAKRYPFPVGTETVYDERGIPVGWADVSEATPP